MKKMLIYLTPLLLLTLSLQFSTVLAQAPTIAWQKLLGGTGTDYSTTFHKTADNGYILGGTAESKDGDVVNNKGGADLWIVKLNALGNVQWTKTLGGPKTESGGLVWQTSDGGYIVGGLTTSSSGDVTGFHGGTKPDIWIVKTNASGGIQWQKTLGGTNDENIVSVQELSDGGYIVGANTSSGDGDVRGFHGITDGWIARLNSDGSLAWQQPVGSTGQDILMQLQVLSAGSATTGYVAVLRTSNPSLVDIPNFHGSSDLWIVRLDLAGQVLWRKCLGGSGAEGNYASIVPSTDGGFIVATTTDSPDGDVTGYHGAGDLWLVKLSSSGAIEWQRSYGGSATDQFSTLQQTADGGYIVGGKTTSSDGDITAPYVYEQAWLFKIDLSGVVQWSLFNGITLSNIYIMDQTSDGGYALAGSCQIFNNGNYDLWMMKADRQGKMIWKRNFGGSGYDEFTCSGKGSYISYTVFAGANQLESNDQNGYLFLASTNSRDGDVNGLHYSPKLKQALNDFWVVKLSADPVIATGAAPASAEINILKVFVSPNPFSDAASIRFTAKFTGLTSVQVFDIQGRRVKQVFTADVQAGKSYEAIFSDRSVPPGLYFYTITNGKQTQTGRMIKK